MSEKDRDRQIRELVVLSAREWPKAVNAEGLLRELDALARLVRVLIEIDADAALSAARREENEECAKVAETEDCFADEIAAAIRARTTGGQHD